MAVRAVRGAIQADTDTREEILQRSAELVAAVLERNGLTADDVISIVFTATPDLTAEFPAYAARLLGLTDVPLLCASEIAVPGALPRTLRRGGDGASARGPATPCLVAHRQVHGVTAVGPELPGRLPRHRGDVPGGHARRSTWSQ